MSLEISSLRELSPAQVEAMISTLAQWMQERHPEVELTRGAFHDLVLYFNGMLNAAIRENIDRVLQSKSLLQITQNPALADIALVDQVLSNFNVSRGNGTAATGQATFVFLLPLRATIFADEQFVVDEIAFRPARTFVILPPTNENGDKNVPANDNERVMIEVGDDTYSVTIPFIAVNPGADGNIKRGTPFAANAMAGNVAEIFATGDFSGGRDPLNNEEYLALLSSGLAAKTIGGRKSYEAFIRNFPEYVNLLHCSVLGCGDVEQQRDQHGLFPISGGGKVDLYLQTTPTAQEIDHILEATYVGIGTNGTIWQVPIDRDVAPGFYDVVRVSALTDRSTNGYEILSDQRGVDTTNIGYVPDIAYIHEGVYSRYQTAVIQFEDSDTLSSGLTLNQSKALYRVTTRGMPLIANIHDTLTSRDHRPRATDVLVKAAIPCFTRISFTIKTETNDIIPPTTVVEIKNAIVAAINKIGFSGQLNSSVIANAAHKFLSGRQAISEVDMFGRIRRPDGTYAYLRNNTTLMVPNDPTRLVTGRTVIFITSPDDISISYGAAGFTL